MDYVQISREALAETLLAAGPGRDTLCEGWRTQELAAHLYLREHRPGAAAGIALPPLAERTERRTRELAATAATRTDFAGLVDRFRREHSLISPRRLPRLAARVNLLEYFVHTEDVRRAVDEWAPRVLDADYEAALWERLVAWSALAYRSSPVGVVLVDPEGYRHVAKRSDDAVAIVGAPGELIMHASGRRTAALVTVEGSAEAIAALAG
ncbi:TIGR03085 family metal-binding protein [Tersicoccus sp. MR15.9]|uniref:TIGR03085 family metal-binding protein n=1 Tax=Tersicoccus mangrovi TaxID=3121635 RepID=UPI002FE5794B